MEYPWNNLCPWAAVAGETGVVPAILRFLSTNTCDSALVKAGAAVVLAYLLGYALPVAASALTGWFHEDASGQ